MKKLFAKANEKFVKAVVLYANANNVLCFDSAATDKVPGAVLKNLFEKNLVLISTSTGLYRPTMFTEETTYYAVSFVNYASSAASLVTYKSDTLPTA